MPPRARKAPRAGDAQGVGISLFDLDEGPLQLIVDLVIPKTDVLHPRVRGARFARFARPAVPCALPRLGARASEGAPPPRRTLGARRTPAPQLTPPPPALREALHPHQTMLL